MAAPLAKTRNAFLKNDSALGEPLPSVCSPVFVLHKDITKKTGAAVGDELNIDNLLFQSPAITNGEYCIPATQPGIYTYLDIFLYIHRPNGTETISTSPILLVHGRQPGAVSYAANASRQNSPDSPSVIIATSKEPRLPASTDFGFNDRAAWWLPLGTSTHTIGTPEVQPSATICGAGGGGTGALNYGITDMVSFLLLGSTDVIVTIKTAGVCSGAAWGMVLGRFSTP